MKQSRFAEIRDAFAEKGMLDRLEKLLTDSAGALAEAKMLRTKMKHTPKGQKRDLIEVDYDVKMAEWAYWECQIGNIERDARYIAHMAHEAQE